MRPKLCILSLSPIRRDARVLRQIAQASKRFEVTVVGWGDLEPLGPHVRMQTVRRVTLATSQRILQVGLLLTGRVSPRFLERWYWRKPDHRRAARLVAASGVDLLHVNEAIALPIAFRAAESLGVPVLFDAHEYSPDQWGDQWALRLLAQPLYTYLMRRYAVRAAAMTTVSHGIAERYRSEFGLAPVVVMNAPRYQESRFRPVDEDRIRLVHHGAAMRNRLLERNIEVVAQADRRYTLDLMLVDTGDGYVDKLRRIARERAPGRVHFLDPVPPAEIVTAISGHDIGLHLMPPVDFNHAMALPNKLFDFIMAGLAVAIGPSPEMARLCKRHGLGIVADDFEPASLARRLDSLAPGDIEALKKRALDAARELNARTEMARLEELWERALCARGVRRQVAGKEIKSQSQS